MNLKDNKKLYLYLGTGIGIMVIIIVIILLISLLSGGRVTFTVAEDKISQIALDYVMDRADLKPIAGEETIITYQELVDAEKIKPLNELLKDQDANCEVNIKIKNHNEHYSGITTLNCGETYQTNTLKSNILNDTVSTSYGLYKIGNEYIYRGEQVNNFVSFNDKLWRIVKINADGDFRLIEVSRKETYVWDDRYNTNTNSNTGINDYRVSRMRETLDSIYETEFSDDLKSYIVSQNVCLGKRDSDSTDNSGSIECSDILQNQYVSLLQANEFVISSIDEGCKALTDRECMNYNYLSTLDRTFWTITADTYKTDKVYKISSTVTSSTTSSSSAIKIVIHLDGDVVITGGDGTEANPYVIKTA